MPPEDFVNQPGVVGGKRDRMSCIEDMVGKAQVILMKFGASAWVRSDPSADIIRAVPSGTKASAMRRSFSRASDGLTIEPMCERSKETVLRIPACLNWSIRSRNTAVSALASSASRTLSPAYFQTDQVAAG